jgi:hypothetical protein
LVLIEAGKIFCLENFFDFVQPVSSGLQAGAVQRVGVWRQVWQAVQAVRNRREERVEQMMPPKLGVRKPLGVKLVYLCDRGVELLLKNINVVLKAYLIGIVE